MEAILSIETSADACSISLLEEHRVISREADEPRSHARMLAPLIKDLLAELDVRPTAVCVDEGPGSYTGLRIGVSTAKGLAWSWDVPLYAIPSLALMAAGVATERGATEQTVSDGQCIRAVISARSSEVFSALYRIEDQFPIEIEAPAVHELEDLVTRSDRDIVVLGSDPLAEKWNEAVIPGRAGNPDPVVLPPHSRFAALLLRNPRHPYRVEDVSSFEPRYLREFVARKPAVSIFERLPF